MQTSRSTAPPLQSSPPAEPQPRAAAAPARSEATGGRLLHLPRRDERAAPEPPPLFRRCVRLPPASFTLLSIPVRGALELDLAAQNAGVVMTAQGESVALVNPLARTLTVELRVRAATPAAPAAAR